MQSRVLIVILNYGTYELTVNLIKELRDNLEYDNYDIMVVDNCSPNNSAEALATESKKLGFIFYANKDNSGYAAGNNIGIRFAIKHGYDYSWILNNDVELREKNVLQHMIDIITQKKEIGGIGPKIYTLDGTICAPYCRRPSFWSMTAGIRAEKKYRERHINESGQVYRIYGCCMLLNNKAMEAVDCMDERTFLYGEEDILAERLKNKGFSFYYDASVSVTHKESASMKQMSSSRKKLQMRETGKSMDLYLKEYRHFGFLSTELCKITRNLITLLR